MDREQINFFRAIDLSVEAHLTGRVWIHSVHPRFSWKMQHKPGMMQSAYRIQAASSPELLNCGADLWDSGKVQSDQSLDIAWQGVPLAARQQIFWRVILWDQTGRESVPSEISCFEISLLRNEDWTARWIYYQGNNPSHAAPCPYFRREFHLEESPVSARLYITARGLFHARMNGERIGRDEFVPGWTDFHKQIQFMTYDVTELLHQGDNAVGVILGDGWYSGNLVGHNRNHYGDHPELLFQLEMQFSDGTSARIVSGEGWKAATGPIMCSDLYDGEEYDSRLEMPGWDQPGFDDAKWQSAVQGEKTVDSPALVQKCCPPVRKIMELRPVQILNPRKDLYIWDFGQNITGRFRVRLKGFPNRVYAFHFAEMLNDDNTLYNLNYRSAKATDYYVCHGPREQEEFWEPLFTFHGFRYMQIDGFQFAGVSVDDVEAVAIVLGSEMEQTGKFTCGHEKVNQLYSNVCWGQRDNFLEVPTDCPQRDERLGWTGDADVFIGAASLNMDVDAFFHKWMRDIREAQQEDGAVAPIAPNLVQFGFAAAVWADAAVRCPWIIYHRYDDKAILAECYDSMKKWVDYQKKTSEELIRPQTDFGDWLAPSAVETPSSMIGTAMFAHTSELLGKTAEILGKSNDAAYYGDLAARVREAFRKKYLDGDGLLNIQSQTACVLALQFNLLKEEQREKNGELLERLVRENGTRLSTGFVGTAWLNQALSSCGHTDTAYDLLLQEEYPSWLFSINQGATTIWERWNSYTKKDGFGNVNMNSFNHYAYGAVAEWIYTTVGGIRYGAPGGKELIFSLQPDPRLKFADCVLQTPYGRVESSWRYEGNRVIWSISAPCNTAVRVKLPSWQLLSVVRGEAVEEKLPITLSENNEMTLENGPYQFILTRKK